MSHSEFTWDFDSFACLALLAFAGVLLVFQPIALFSTLSGVGVLVLAILRPDWLLYLLILTLPLQGTLVLTYRANIKVSELLGCVLIIALAFRLLIWRKRFRCDSRIAAPLVCFLLVVLLSTLNTPRFRSSMVLNQYMELGVGRDSPDARSYITAMWGVYCALLLISVPAVLENTNRLFLAFRALLWGGAASAVFGIFQWIYLLKADMLFELPGSVYHLDVVHSTADGFPRSPSTFTEPSLFASFLILLMPITLALAVGSYPRIIGRRTASMVFVLEVIALLLSFSVSGYVLFLITIALFLYLTISGGSRGKVVIIARRAMLGGVALLLTASALQSVGVYPADVGEFVVQRLLGQADSAQQRFGLAQIGWEMAKDHFLTGVGIGNFPFLAMSYGAQHSIVLMQFIFPTPSNLIILFLAELGVPGLLLFGWLVFRVYGFMAAGLHEVKQEFRILHIGLCGSMAGAALTFVFLDNLFVNYVWVLLGMAFALHRLARADSSQPNVTA